MKYSLSKVACVCAATFLATTFSISQALATDAFKAGDEFVVVQQGAPLMRGSSTLATFSQGQRLKVLATQGEWVGTSAVVNGQTVGGWVHQRQVTTPSQYAQRRTTRRYSYQPGPATGSYAYPSRGYSRSSSNGNFIMGQSPYGPSYWRADRKIKGY